MFVWFIALAVLGVVLVFRDPRLDHRMVALGSVVPHAGDLLAGVASGAPTRVGPAHSMVVHVALLAVVMVSSIGRRALRKRLIALSIGGFAFLILDTAWTRTASFAWPITTRSFEGRSFVYQRPLLVNVVLEVVGLIVAVVLVKRCRLERKTERESFLRSGTLEFHGPSPRKR